SDLLSGQQSIAQFLGTDSVLHALKQIEQGDVSEHWFELVGEQWDIEQKLKQQLAAMGLPQDPDFSCARLSGGQLARLQLWQLFENEAELLIL
ncbi:ABC transporter ATP-binding protein, partial [Escherichia coli]|nr:ABC transporter ATP-binding protein [Escherichia coli]